MRLTTIKHPHSSHVLHAAYIETPLGMMLAAADEEHLFLLEYVEQQDVNRTEQLQTRTNCIIVSGANAIHQLIEKELIAYFAGTLKQFTVPLKLLGTPFQQQTWKKLLQIPYGETISYTQLAYKIEKPLAHRAVANANGANNMAVIIPCHRVINSNGNLGGYRSGISRKQWLLDHEKKYVSSI